MDRLEAFEKMLFDLKQQSEYEQSEMDKLKLAGKEKSATYKQYFSNRMLYRVIGVKSDRKLIEFESQNKNKLIFT